MKALMKALKTLIIFSTLSLSTQAKLLKGEVSFTNYGDAEKRAHLTWIVESTKVGLFSSDVYGYVLNYRYSADYNPENGILRNMEISFPIKAMNSDNESRDEKLHTKCMGFPEYENITVKVSGPLFLTDKKERSYQGIALIRGKEQPFTINMTANENTQIINVKGSTIWSLKKMKIPDPSIAVAKLSDDIRLNISLEVPMN